MPAIIYYCDSNNFLKLQIIYSNHDKILLAFEAEKNQRVNFGSKGNR